jgi:hypothetical protein
MQEPQQIQSGIGSLQEPRQGYFVGKLVKKAGRALKKVVKSPLGKAALIGGLGMYAGGLGPFSGLKGAGFLRGTGGSLLGKLRGGEGFLGGLGNMFRHDPSLGIKSKFSMGKMLMGGLGATALAAPFLMGGDDEEEIEEEVFDPRYQVQRAKNYYSGAGDAGAGLDFMPQKKYVMQNFYAADGGRAGYANGMMVEEDDEEEYIRSGAGMSRRQPQTFLNMGGGAGQAQAEQMLMMEYVKYKNKGGTLSFEQFVKAVMQEAAPEGAGMEQPVAMAADGGLMTQVPGYTTPEGYNKFDYPSGGKEVRVGKQEGGIMETEVSEEIMPLLDMDGKEKDYRNTGGFVELGRKEKADDVPARLSKNEFVFTADAVRNAGGGDIDKGAEVMENLMNNLEQGGEISEESQGLEGAQAMYEQQQMLQSRIV